jgi:hypothetical protein
MAFAVQLYLKYRRGIRTSDFSVNTYSRRVGRQYISRAFRNHCWRGMTMNKTGPEIEQARLVTCNALNRGELPRGLT